MQYFFQFFKNNTVHFQFYWKKETGKSEKFENIFLLTVVSKRSKLTLRLYLLARILLARVGRRYIMKLKIDQSRSQADPFIFQDGDRYYLYVTGADGVEAYSEKTFLKNGIMRGLLRR